MKTQCDCCHTEFGKLTIRCITPVLMDNGTIIDVHQCRGCFLENDGKDAAFLLDQIFNHRFDLMLDVTQHVRKQPFIYDPESGGKQEIYEQWNMLLKYNAENTQLRCNKR